MSDSAATGTARDSSVGLSVGQSVVCRVGARRDNGGGGTQAPTRLSSSNSISSSSSSSSSSCKLSEYQNLVRGNQHQGTEFLANRPTSAMGLPVPGAACAENRGPWLLVAPGVGGRVTRGIERRLLRPRRWLWRCRLTTRLARTCDHIHRHTHTHGHTRTEGTITYPSALECASRGSWFVGQLALSLPTDTQTPKSRG